MGATKIFFLENPVGKERDEEHTVRLQWPGSLMELQLLGESAMAQALDSGSKQGTTRQ